MLYRLVIMWSPHCGLNIVTPVLCDRLNGFLYLLLGLVPGPGPATEDVDAALAARARIVSFAASASMRTFTKYVAIADNEKF